MKALQMTNNLNIFSLENVTSISKSVDEFGNSVVVIDFSTIQHFQRRGYVNQITLQDSIRDMVLVNYNHSTSTGVTLTDETELDAEDLQRFLNGQNGAVK